MDSVPPTPLKFRDKGADAPVPRRYHSILRLILRYVFPVAIVGLIVIGALTAYLQKWLWMGELHFRGIFWTLLAVQWSMFAVAFICAFAFLWVNLHHALRVCGALGSQPLSRNLLQPDLSHVSDVELTPHLLRSSIIILSLWLAWFGAIIFFGQWDTYLRFRYGGSFGLADPLYGIDVGFYVFKLPFYELLQAGVLMLTLGTLFLVSVIYGYFQVAQLRQKPNAPPPPLLSHLSLLLCILVADIGIGFVLDHFALVYSTMGVVYGAGFTAAHVTQYALWIMVALSIVACAFLAINVARPRLRFLFAGISGYVVAYFLAVLIVPALFQKIVVQPSELALETPYLKHYIDFTRQAYDLNTVLETSYPALTDLTPDVIQRNQDTIQNIRLWDERPLLQMYQQTQAIRLYYQFYDVGVDRYHLQDGYHQVMLATRELSQQLPEAAQTWVNENLEFTHGYGIVMNKVSNAIGGGFPDYLIENVPPVSTDGLTVTQPAIYYGQGMTGDRIVATSNKEFDYPKGNDNVYTSYAGSGGIPIDSIFRRVLLAWTQQDINILFTAYLKPSSRIQIWRDVQKRVAEVAPFLSLDSDPYPVLSGGHLYWIQDAYTTSSGFPYAQPHQAGFGGSLNYLRNSVKVIVDMYDGSVSFYNMDPKDPVLAAYSRAFPGVFQNLSRLSPDLTAHLRYPEDLFAIQADEYKTFHMTDPQVFYNREDLWQAPNASYDGQSAPMDPYYILMKLPGSNTLEYLLMTPFTPDHRSNMISWMAARCDFPNYGRKLFYELPKDKLIYGPNQIEAMIDQNPTISQQLTLWNQMGSHVIRGRLIVTPIENAFLYVVPVYLQAAGENFPQLKRVIAVTGDRVVMALNLNDAIKSLFTEQQPMPVFGTSSAQ
jgi:uncharacterized membrane protein (UPF0182 family)